MLINFYYIIHSSWCGCTTNVQRILFKHNRANPPYTTIPNCAYIPNNTQNKERANAQAISTKRPSTCILALPRCIIKHHIIYRIIDININGISFFCSSLCFFRFIIVSSFHLFMFPRPLSDLLMFQLSHPTHVIPSQSILDLIKHSPMVAFLSFDPQFSFSPSSEKSVLHSGPSLSFVPSDHFASVLSLLK